MPSWWRLPDANPEVFLAIYDRYVDRVPAPLLHKGSGDERANPAPEDSWVSSGAVVSARRSRRSHSQRKEQHA
jgi:hypothetical protein